MAPLEQIIQPAPLAAPRLSLLAAIPVREVILTEGGNPATDAAGNPQSDALAIDGEVWRQGSVTWTPEPCGLEGGTFDPSCNGPAVNLSGDGSTVTPAEEFHPIAIFEPESCSTFGYAGIDTDGRARRAIGLAEARLVEAELWTGALASAIGGDYLNNRWLARNVAAPVDAFPPAVTQLKGGAAQTPTRALAELEQEIANRRAGGRGIIHALPRTVTYWTENGHLYRQGNVLLTVARDTIVVPGEGYTGSSPAGVVDATGDTAWAYATGMIEAFRGPVELLRPSSPELTTHNLRTSIAVRRYALLIDPCVYVGIKVQHS